MSRIKNLARALASGYVALGANVLYTLGTVPVALHYLSKPEFGLWALVSQISGYLLLVDLGMAGSISRILIDHKDTPADGTYGSVIKTGTLVLVVQGAIVALAGTVVSFCLAGLFDVPVQYHRDFQWLVAGQCLVTGGLFAVRMAGHILQAHQRYDVSNYAQVGYFLVGFGTMWLGFERGLGLYSLLVANAAAALCNGVIMLVAVFGLRLCPPAGAWGRASRRTFRDLFAYGQEIFLLSVGQQLVNASQVMVIARTLGLDAAAIWSIGTKSFTLAQQVVYRIFDFSASAFAEMIVRGERERLLGRFRDVVVLSASFGIWAGLAAAICNQSFLAILTKSKIQWEVANDWLMALLVIVYSTTRCFTGFTGITKQIRAMKYVYLIEGVVFVGLSVLVARPWGIAGIIGVAVATNLLCSGWYGVARVREYFGLTESGLVWSWLRSPMALLALLAFGLGIVELAIDVQGSAIFQFATKAFFALTIGGVGFWFLGLRPQLKAEIIARLAKWRGRIIPVTKPN